MRSNRINEKNAWYQLGRLIAINIDSSEFEIFLRENNMYSNFNLSLDISYPEGTFEKICSLLDKVNISTVRVKKLYLEWDLIQEKNIKAFDRYSFWWGYDIAALEIKNEYERELTFSEATEMWNLGSSTLRMLVRTDKLIENIDYRKSGGTWLITIGAMKRIYGEPKNVLKSISYDAMLEFILNNVEYNYNVKTCLDDFLMNMNERGIFEDTFYMSEGQEKFKINVYIKTFNEEDAEFKYDIEKIK